MCLFHAGEKIVTEYFIMFSYFSMQIVKDFFWKKNKKNVIILSFAVFIQWVLKIASGCDIMSVNL